MRRFPVSRDKRFKRPTEPDFGPPERWQHSGRLLQRVDATSTAARATTECTLDLLHEQGRVTPKMWQAGIKLRRDYLLARVEPRTVMRYAPTFVRGNPQASGPFDRSEKEELAYKRWRQALQIVGVGLNDALVTVCCLDLRPHPRQHRDLIEALDALVKHYRI